MPEIIGVAWFIPGAVREGHYLLSRDFRKRVNQHDSAVRQVRELFVGPQDRPGIEWKYEVLADRDIHFQAAASR